MTPDPPTYVLPSIDTPNYPQVHQALRLLPPAALFTTVYTLFVVFVYYRCWSGARAFGGLPTGAGIPPLPPMDALWIPPAETYAREQEIDGPLFTAVRKAVPLPDPEKPDKKPKPKKLKFKESGAKALCPARLATVLHRPDRASNATFVLRVPAEWRDYQAPANVTSQFCSQAGACPNNRRCAELMPVDVAIAWNLEVYKSEVLPGHDPVFITDAVAQCVQLKKGKTGQHRATEYVGVYLNNSFSSNYIAAGKTMADYSPHELNKQFCINVSRPGWPVTGRRRAGSINAIFHPTEPYETGRPSSPGARGRPAHLSGLLRVGARSGRARVQEGPEDRDHGIGSLHGLQTEPKGHPEGRQCIQEGASNCVAVGYGKAMWGARP